MILKNLQNCQSVEIPRKANQAFPKAMRLWKNKEKVLLTNLLSAAWFSPSILAKPPPNPSPGSGLKRARHALTQRPSGETAGFHRGFPPSKANKLQQEVLRSKGAQSLPETKQPKPLKIGPNAPKGRSRHPSLRGEHYPSKSPWRRPETFCPNSDRMKDPSITSVQYPHRWSFSKILLSSDDLSRGAGEGFIPKGGAFWQTMYLFEWSTLQPSQKRVVKTYTPEN